MNEKRHINHDERLGDTNFEFTMTEIIACYRGNHWDRRDDGTVMTEEEIIEDVLTHDVEEA